MSTPIVTLTTQPYIMIRHDNFGVIAQWVKWTRDRLHATLNEPDIDDTTKEWAGRAVVELDEILGVMEKTIKYSPLMFLRADGALEGIHGSVPDDIPMPPPTPGEMGN